MNYVAILAGAVLIDVINNGECGSCSTLDPEQMAGAAAQAAAQAAIVAI